MQHVCRGCVYSLVQWLTLNEAAVRVAVVMVQHCGQRLCQEAAETGGCLLLLSLHH